MTRQETAEILSTLKVAYPDAFRNVTKDDAVHQLNLWVKMLGEYPAEIVMAAVEAYIRSDTKNRFPSIGAINGIINSLAKPSQMTADEAWELISKAMENSLYNSKKEFEKLPEPLQRIVGSHNQLRVWATMEIGIIQSVVRSNFIKDYNAHVESERQTLAIPQTTREKIGVSSPTKISRI